MQTTLSRTIALAAACLSVLAATATAQTPGQPSQAYAMSNKDIGKIVTGEFTGDSQVDAVVVVEQRPVLLASVEVFDTYLEASSKGRDIDVLPGTGAGGLDQLVQVGNKGLRVFDYGGAWSSTLVRGTGTPWTAARAVRVGLLDGTAGPDVAAVTPSKVLLLASDGMGGFGPETSFTTVGAGVSLELLYWDAKEGLEIAVITSSGVEIYNTSGALLSTITVAQGPVLATPLAVGAMPFDRLAVLSTDPTTGHWEVAVHDSLSAEGPWDLGDIGAIDVAAALWDEGPDEDLLVVGTSSTKVRVYANGMTTGGPTIDPVNGLQLVSAGHPGRVTSVQDGGLSVTDVDHDGDPDVLVAVQGTYIGGSWAYDDSRFSEVAIARNGTVDERAFHPSIYVDFGDICGPWNPRIDPATARFTLFFTAPATPISGASLEVQLWRAASLKGEIDSTPHVPLTALTLPSGAERVEFSFIGTPGCKFPEVYPLVVRQVLRGEGGVILEQGPAMTALITSHLNRIPANAGYETIIGLEPCCLGDPDDPGGVSVGTRPPPPPPSVEPM